MRRAGRFGECRRGGCDCGVFLNPATEEMARAFGQSFGESVVRNFKEHPEHRGPNFDWDRSEHFVRSMSVPQWRLSARYGFEDIVAEAAVAAWRAGKGV